MAVTLRIENVPEEVAARLEERAKKSSRRAAKEKDIVQIKNPRSGRYVKIDRSVGKIITHKKSDGPYKDVPIARQSE